MKRTLIGVAAAFLALSLTSCASASPRSPETITETEYITQLVEVRPQMTAALAADAEVCAARMPADNGSLAAGYLDCAAIAANNACRITALQAVIEGEPVPPDICPD